VKVSEGNDRQIQKRFKFRFSRYARVS